MGEMHYARYPERYWEEEILKMKAGGIGIVATYVFWIHHEEVEGQFDWREQRNLRRFVELCAKHALFVWVRIGPWAHGEARNGGLPDWLLRAGPTRQNDPVYLSHVRRFYGEISAQLKGLFWKDGGPVIGVQIENEYTRRGANSGADHILALLRLAGEAGIDAPFYTVTGWDGVEVPSRGVIPVFGGYTDGFWYRSLVDLPPNPNYFFTTVRCQENVGDDLRSTRPDIDAGYQGYPFFTAEMGGGMEVAYHRRPVMRADDVTAPLVTKLGSGVNLYGYYMFQGGTNPEGKLTTLQESQATDYPNDLPVAAYDYRAPLGEFGQVRRSYRTLKSFHLFLEDFGSYLAPMTAYFPDRTPAGLRDDTTPRVAARFQGDHGFVFFNNYQRTYPLRAHPGVRIALKTASERIELPRRPVDIPSGAYFIWPVNLDLGGITLKYATAQLLSKLGKESTYFFFAWPGMAPEFAFDAQALDKVEAPHAQTSVAGGRLYVTGITPGTEAALTVRSKSGKRVRIVVLMREQAENCWKASVGGGERLILSRADVFVDRDRLHLRARDNSKLEFAVFPALDRQPSGKDGVFTRYAVVAPPKKIAVRWEQTRVAAPSAAVKMGPEVAMAPTDAGFERAGAWHISLPKDALAGVADVFLRIEYVGDAGRLYLGGRLLTDDFYKGTEWEIGLKRFGEEALAKGFDMKILPLRKDAPIYIERNLRPALPASGESAVLKSVSAAPGYEAVVDLGAGQSQPGAK